MWATSEMMSDLGTRYLVWLGAPDEASEVKESWEVSLGPVL